MASQILLFPEPTERPMRAAAPSQQAHPTGCAALPRGEVISWQHAVRVRRIDSDLRHRDQAGRMVMSGRMADVCAALDQMVAAG